MRPSLGCALLLSFLSSTALAEGNELEAVRTALGSMLGAEPIQATVAITRWERATGEKTPQEASAGATFSVAASKSSVSLSCNESLLGAKSQKKKGAPDALGSIVDDVTLSRASRWLNQAAPLLKQLETAELVEDKASTLDERPARVLKLKLKTEKLAESGAEATTERAMTLWVDEEHVPLASELESTSSGGFLVVRFDAHQKSERKYARAGDRLLLVEETEAASSTTMGRTFQNKQSMKLTVK